jgi:hypothetical protein
MQKFTMTEWFNPTSHDAKIVIHQGPGAQFLFEVPAGGKAALSSEYDDAIRTIKDGVVVSGLCPWLEKAGQTDKPRVATALALPSAPTPSPEPSQAPQDKKDHKR